MIYRNLSSLVPAQKLLAEAGKALQDPARTIRTSDIPEILGAAGGIGAGAALGAGVLSASAAAGTSGAAALTSGLAGAGALIGGGMLLGIAVVAAPAVILAVVGFWLISRRNRRRLLQRKEGILQEALRKRDALLRQLHDVNVRNDERVRYLDALVIQLGAVIANLEEDLQRRKTA